MHKSIFVFFVGMFLVSCASQLSNNVKTSAKAPFVWQNANVYFLLTDRFNNADVTNDVNFGRNKPTGPFRGFEGGDFKGITNKIEDGYFNKLGINVLWFSPIAEQGHGITDEGTGPTYGYHGYWAKDWTAIDPNWGTEQEFATLIKTAHQHGIRILMDVVINHIAPNTLEDPQWGDDWVRMQPTCTYNSYESTVSCTLVDNLPDVKTEKMEDVALPSALVQKWTNENRLEQELKELDEFFVATKYPRAPRYYIIKWLTDFIRKYGIDGLRLDTVKHTEANVWSDLWTEAAKAFADWKKANPKEVLDQNDFFMVGEVYNYGISSRRNFNNGGEVVDYYAHGIQGLINFQFKVDADSSYESIFSKYSRILHTDMAGLTVLNYLTSHDDGHPFDKSREKSMDAATKLLLSPGASQIYYGDETNRNLTYPDAIGDATLRSFMNWDELDNNKMLNGIKTQDLWKHYATLGNFRINNPAVGAGIHTEISKSPYVFKRVFERDGYQNKVIVALDVKDQALVVPVDGIFDNGTQLVDYYSMQKVTVRNGKVKITSSSPIVLLAL